MGDSQSEIESLIHLYAERIDRGDFEGVADLFADAVIRAPGRAAGARGREAVQALYESTTRRYPDDGTPHTQHVTSNVRVEVDEAADRASARSCFTVLQALPDLPLQPIIAGRYHDQFERVDGRWRFSERLMLPDLYGDLSRHLLVDLPVPDAAAGAVDPSLKLLLDRAEISDVVHAYATGLDRGDWALYRSIFTDEVDLDFSSVGIPARVYKADDWVRDARTLFAGFDATQHVSSNHVHDVRGDEATCVSSMKAEHFIGDGANDRWTIGGYYTNELVRTDAGWKIRKLTLTATWTRGNPEVPRIARKRGRERQAKSGP